MRAKKSDRQAHGAWMTPTSLATHFARRALSRWIELPSEPLGERLRLAPDPLSAPPRPLGMPSRLLSVLDPACGEGALLVAAASEMADMFALGAPDAEHADEEVRISARREARRLILRDIGRLGLIRGIELDPGRAAVARASLVALTGEPTAGDRILCADSLERAWPKSDLVIANPPWLGGMRISGQLGDAFRKSLVRRFPTMRGTSNLAVAWILKAAEQRCERASFLMPIGISQGDSRQAWSPLIRDKEYVIVEAEKNFAWPGDAAVTCCMVHLDRCAT